MPALLTTRSSGAAAARAATASMPASLAEIGDQHLDLGLVRGAEALRERLQPIAPAGDDDQVVAGRGELLGKRLADASRRAGDESEGT